VRFSATASSAVVIRHLDLARPNISVIRIEALSRFEILSGRVYWRHIVFIG
jgi:hypothetical protein